MKAETDPITPDEWLLRLVWKDRFTNRQPIISTTAFEPRTGRNPEIDGISLFRKDCLNDPLDVLLAVQEDKRDNYGVVQIPLSSLAALGLTVKPAPAVVAGHVVIPEINSVEFKHDRARVTLIMLRLAEKASENILLRP